MVPTVLESIRAQRICIVEEGLMKGLAFDPEKVHLQSCSGILEGEFRETVDFSLYCIIATESYLSHTPPRFQEWIFSRNPLHLRIIVLSDGSPDKDRFAPFPEDMIQVVLPVESPPALLKGVAEMALENMELYSDRMGLIAQLGQSFQEIRRLTGVGQYLASERDFDRLIGLILEEAKMLVAADGGSIYVTERHAPGSPPTHIRFKKSSMALQGGEFILPINKKSIAGYVALTGEPLVIDDVYSLSGSEDYHFNSEFDHAHNYRTRSMIVIPMKNHREEVIGVIQLINRKRDPSKKLTFKDMIGDGVVAFTDRDRELGMALAGQAAVAIENNQLIQDINNLFEGFVKAAVHAIEQRDPITSGHSFRVAELTVALAKAVDESNEAPFENVHFTPEQIRELRYAGLLHDFGKVGVPENVLKKARKLYDEELEVVRWRFRYIREKLKNILVEKKVKVLRDGPGDSHEFEMVLDQNIDMVEEKTRELFRTIEEFNEPVYRGEYIIEILKDIASRHIDVDGKTMPYLTEEELENLSVIKGNLTAAERTAIEHHVTHTFNFLTQIPWTGDLRSVPEIAHGHHEKMDGTGYPLGIPGDRIVMQARMMAIADIYDALTAPDRPYKKSLTTEESIKIMREEAERNHLDPDLLRLFVEKKIYAVLHENGIAHEEAPPSAPELP